MRHDDIVVHSRNMCKVSLYGIRHSCYHGLMRLRNIIGWRLRRFIGRDEVSGLRFDVVEKVRNLLTPLAAGVGGRRHQGTQGSFGLDR